MNICFNCKLEATSAVEENGALPGFLQLIYSFEQYLRLIEVNVFEFDVASFIVNGCWEMGHRGDTLIHLAGHDQMIHFVSFIELEVDRPVYFL